MVRAKPMVIGMPEIIIIKVFKCLFKHCSFCYLTDKYYVQHRSVIFTIYFLSLLEVWVDL